MAEETQIPTVYLFRIGVNTSSPKDKPPAIGVRGVMVIGSVSLYTIERGGGYVILPKGTFECTMEQHKRLGKVFRVKDSGENGHNVTNDRGYLAGMLIHSANFPHEIVGCVAPGKTYLGNGVGETKKAMQELIQYCGGWGVGKKMMLDVDSI